MAWIELHQTVWDDKKTVILAAKLGIPPIYAAAHMAHLWCWGLDNTPTGVLEGLPDAVIAHGAGWTGDASAFVEAAKVAGFIDRDPLALHDWDDYAGRLIERRTAERERSRQRRAAVRKPAEDHKPTGGRPADDQQTACGTVPNRTVPNRTQPNQDQDQKKDPPASPAVIIPKYENQDMAMAELHRSLILMVNPSAKVPENLGKWANAYRLMRERDKRDPARTAAILRWIFTDPTCWSGWKTNILSADKLREKYDKLNMQMGLVNPSGPRMSDKERRSQAALSDFLERRQTIDQR